MEKKRINVILDKVASENGASVDEVLFEMESAISQAHHKAMLSNDKALLRLWEDIPRKGDIPTPAEMIDFLSKKVLTENDDGFGNFSLM